MILAIFFILFLGFVLRLSSIFHHLPEFPHIDEKIILGIISTFRISDLIPPADFIYPGLVYYILWPIIFFCDQFFSAYLVKLFDFDLFNVHIIIGRAFIILLSMFYINVIYSIGKRLFNIKVGLMAALFLALNPLCVSLSSIIRPDMLMSLLILISFLFICNLYNNDESRCLDYVLAGLFIGLATAAKYPALLGIAPLLVVHFMKTKDKFWLINKNMLLVLLFIGIAFFLFNPFIILNFKSFFRDVTNEFNLAVKGFAFTPTINRVGWINYLTGLNSILGRGIFILSVGGLILAIYRHTKKDILILSFPVIFYIVMGVFKRSPSRYILPIVPFILLVAAEFLIVIFDVIKRVIVSKKIRYGIIISLIFISILPSFCSIAYYNKWVNQKDTRILAKEWIKSNIPPMANILMDGNSEDVTFIFNKIEQHPYRLEIIKWEGGIDYSKFFDAGKFDFIVIRDIKDRPAYIEPLYDFISKNFLMVKEFKPVIAKPESNFIYLEIYNPKIKIYSANRKTS